MLVEFAHDLWTCEGPVVTAAAGFHYPTRMVVIRMASDELLVWSPIAGSEELYEEIEALGPVRYLVAPNTLHDRFVAEWQARYPAARALGAPSLRERRPDLRLEELGPAPIDGWTGQIDFVAVEGNAITTEVVFFHHASATVIFTDLLQQSPRGWFHGWRALVARLDLMTGDEPRVPRKFRAAFTDRPAARRAMARVLDWPTQRVIMAHGRPVMADGREFLHRTFAWLMKRPG